MATDARILLVDDDADCRRAIARWLTTHGFDVECAGSTEEADACLARGDHDVLLSDIRMPGNGELQWIEAVLRQHANLAVVLLTGNPELQTAIRAANLPIAAYLVKPPDLEELCRVISREQKRQRQHADFAALIDDIDRLTTSRGQAMTDELTYRLKHVSRTLSLERENRFRSFHPTPAQSWQLAVFDAIDVLERTKQNFRSRELGALRARLETLLHNSELPAPAPVTTAPANRVRPPAVLTAV